MHTMDVPDLRSECVGICTEFYILVGFNTLRTFLH
jgi:hypothetical protein